MKNEKIYKKKKTLNYAIYMIAGSYFKKAVCKSSYVEARHKLIYAEAGAKTQYTFEERCIKYIRKSLMPNLDRKIWEQEVTVEFLPDGVRFIGPEYAIEIVGKDRGAKTYFNCRIWKKEAEGVLKKAS